MIHVIRTVFQVPCTMKSTGPGFVYNGFHVQLAETRASGTVSVSADNYDSSFRTTATIVGLKSGLTRLKAQLAGMHASGKNGHGVRGNRVSNFLRALIS